MKNKLLLLLLIVGILFTPIITKADLTTDILAYYTLDEITGTSVRDSTGLYNGTANNQQIFTNEYLGIINTSADFTKGNDYIQLNNSLSNLVQGTEFTISFWIKGNATSDKYAIGFGNTGTANTMFGLSSEDSSPFNKMRVFSRNSAGTQDISGHVTNGIILNNTWVNVIVTGNASLINIYINGVFDSSISYTRLSKTFNTATIGAVQRNSIVGFADFYMDEVAFYTRMFNSGDVTDLYQAGLNSEQYPFTPPVPPPDQESFNLTAINTVNSTSLTNFSVIMSGEVPGAMTGFDDFENSLDSWVNVGSGGTLSSSTEWSSWGQYSLRMRIITGIGNQAIATKSLGDFDFLELDLNIPGGAGNFTIWEGDYGTGTLLYNQTSTGIYTNIILEITPFSNLTFHSGDFITSYVDNIRYNFIREGYSTTNGLIITNPLSSLSKLWNFSYSSNQEPGYITRLYDNINMTTLTFQGALFPEYFIYGINYTNFTTYTGNDYVRVLSYTLDYYCPSSSPGNLTRYINGVLQNSALLTCNDMINTITRTYIHPIEGSFDIIVGILAPNGFGYNTSSRTFISDLLPPTITGFDIIIPTGFNIPTYNVSVQCADNVFPQLTYNLTRQNTNIYVTNYSNNTIVNNALGLIDGIIPHTFACSDAFSSTSQTKNAEIQYKNITIINEKTGARFDVQNLTNAVLILQSPVLNQTLNLKTLNVTQGFLVTNITKNFRLELEYSNGDIITRDLNTNIVDTNTPICANTDPTIHYEQFIISATTKPAIVRSNLHNCYVLADTTRFAFQNNFMAKFYTISSLYSLGTKQNGEESLLASIDGGTPTTINLDTIGFGSTLFNLNIRESQVMIRKHPTSNSTIIIYFYNPKNDNDALNIKIFYNNTLYFESTTITSPNNITINFDFTTLGIPDDAIFKIVFEELKTEGSTNTITTYYSLTGSSGSFPVGIALVIGVVMLISLLTMVAPSYAFGFFGILATIFGIFILALAPSVWYGNLFIGVFIIIGIFQFLNYVRPSRVGGGMV